MTRADVDQLGKRLRACASPSKEDLVLLDEYRRSLSSFSRDMTSRLEALLSLRISERPGKTTPSIVAKLKRQDLLLSKIQDIAGGRAVVADLIAQDAAGTALRNAFPQARVIDRREKPVVGYHALHFVLREDEQSYELQLRTLAQQRWAQLSEKFADIVGFDIKYGGGPTQISELLTKLGELIFSIERLKRGYFRLLEAETELAALDSTYVKTYSEVTVAAEIQKDEDELNVNFAQTEQLITIMQSTPR